MINYHFYHTILSVNPLPNNKIFNATKFKSFAEDNINVPRILISQFDRNESTVGKGENALLPTVISKAFFFRVIKSQDYVVKIEWAYMTEEAFENIAPKEENTDN